MSIVFDSTANGTSAATASTLSFTHVTGSLSNGVIMVLVYYIAAAGTVWVNSISYPGVILVRGPGQHASAQNADVWYGFNPVSGSGTVQIVLTGTVTAGSKISAVSFTFSGVNKIYPPDGFAGSTIGATAHTSQSDAVTTITKGDILLDIMGSTTLTTLTANSPQINDNGTLGTGGTGQAAASRLAIRAAQTTNMGWTFSSTSVASVHQAIALRPFVNHTLATMGVGQ